MVDLVKATEDKKAEEPKAPVNKVQELSPVQDLSVKGRFNRYNSPFLQLMIPALTLRYVWESFEEINPFKNLLGKTSPEEQLRRKSDPPQVWQKPTLKKYIQYNIAAIGTGATMLGIIGYYSKRTAEDIRTVYAESVGYELDKKTEDVTWRDIFLKSNNKALEVTRGAYESRTLGRLAAGASFLLPWHALRVFPSSKPKFGANVKAGVGVLGTFLLLDSMIRKPSFFDMEQNLVAQNINHADEISYETIGTKNIQNLLLVHRRHIDKDYKWPSFATVEGKQQAVLATRIADLMNQAYNNTDRTEEGNFTIGKFNFLVGFGMLDKYPEALAYVELAKNSLDMKDVKQVAAAIKEGKDAQSAFMECGVDMQGLVRKHTDLHSTPDAPQKKFTEMVEPAKDKAAIVQRSLKDFATTSETPTSLNL